MSITEPAALARKSVLRNSAPAAPVADPVVMRAHGGSHTPPAVASQIAGSFRSIVSSTPSGLPWVRAADHTRSRVRGPLASITSAWKPW